MKNLAIQNLNPGVRLPILLAALTAAGGVVIGVPTDAAAQGTSPSADDYMPEKYSPSRYRSVYANSAFEREILPPQKEDAGPPPTNPIDYSGSPRVFDHD